VSGAFDRRFLGLADFEGKLLAHHGQLGRRFNAETHRPAGNFDDGDGDLIADKNPLANFSRNDQHGWISVPGPTAIKPQTLSLAPWRNGSGGDSSLQAFWFDLGRLSVYSDAIVRVILAK
jgi:hypothetical protein